MNSPIDDFRTPGQFIKHLLNQRGWNQTVLAAILGMDQTLVNKLVNDKRPVTAEIALKLGDAFIVEPEHFLILQAHFELAMARIVERPDPGRSTRAKLFGDYPISEMIKRRWIAAESVRDTVNVEASLAKFFGATSIQDIEVLPHAAKKTKVATDATPAQTAWLYRVRGIASELMVGERYTPQLGRGAVAQLKELTGAVEETRKVPRILTEAGIRFVIVESLPSAKIDGVCFWLDESSPVVGITLRYDRIDNFWFVLRHEIEHVLLSHGRADNSIQLDSELEGAKAGTSSAIPEEERLANEAAANFCVPRKKLESFVARKAPFFTERDFLGFANTLHVHPGIVAGILQHETGRYDLFRNHLVKIRQHIAPSAVVDGWGDVYPVGL